MANINKIKDLCKKNGIKQGYLCDVLGLQKVYLNDVARGRSSMSDDRIQKIADILGTTYEYLTDQTDDPLPKMSDIIASAESVDEGIILKVMDKLTETTEDEMGTLDEMFSLSPQDFSRVLEVVKLFMKK